MLQRLTQRVDKDLDEKESRQKKVTSHEVKEQWLSDISIAMLRICTRSAMLTLARIAWYERAVFRRLFTAPQLRAVQIDIMPK